MSSKIAYILFTRYKYIDFKILLNVVSFLPVLVSFIQPAVMCVRSYDLL